MTVRDIDIAEYAKQRLCVLHAESLAETDRAEYFATIREEDPDLAAAVEGLLKYLPPTEPPKNGGIPEFDQQPGDHINRFRIIKPLGRGGMGAVYEAHDPVRNERVALKTILPQLATIPSILRRFIDEINNGMRVSDKHVCRINDLVPQDSADSPLAFTMELLKGETLLERLRRDKKLAPEEALPLARQMADGLEALHEHEVWHRDFKPGNIFLVETESDEPLVKITDFGLSRRQPRGLRDDDSISQPGEIPGTLPYMAPEQLRGEKKKVGAATDVYAFGLVLYEMVTGLRPFSAKSSAENLVQKAETTPKPPTELSPGLDEDWDKAILQCLKPNIAGRPKSPGDVIRILEGSMEPQPVPAPGPVVDWRFWATTAAVAAVLIILLAAFSDEIRQWFIEEQRVAVLPFKAIDGPPSDQTFADGLTLIVTRQISKFEGINKELMVTAPSTVINRGVMTPQQALEELGVNLAVAGELQIQGSVVRVFLGLVDTETDLQIETADISGTRDDVLRLQDEIVAQLATLLNLTIQPKHVDEDDDDIAPGAHEFYTSALGNLQRSDDTASVRAAITLLEQAIRAGGESPLYYAALCDSHWTLYERHQGEQLESVDRAAEACGKAEALGRERPEVQVTLGRYYAGIGDYAKALNNYESARDSNPRNADAFLGLAQVYALQGKIAEAEATYQDALRLRKGDWRIYRHLCRFRHDRGDFERAIEPCQRVVQLIPNSAQAHQNLGVAFASAGRLGDARREFHEAVRIEPTPLRLQNLAKTYLDSRDFETAAKYYEQARDRDSSDYRVWQDLAAVYEALGDPRAAGTYASAAIEAKKRLEVNPELHTLWARIAHYLAGAGDRSGVLKWLARAEERVDEASVRERALNAATYAKIGDRAACLRWANLAAGTEDGRNQLVQSRWLQDFLGESAVLELTESPRVVE